MFVMSTLEVIIEFICLLILTPRYHVLSVAMVMLIGLFTTLVLSSFYVYKSVYSSHHLS